MESPLSVGEYDAVFLGGGAATKNLAPHLARSGLRTVIVERQWVGGACPNVACLPSKDEIWSAKVGQLARNGAHYGVVTGPVSTDMARVRERKRELVARMVDFYHRRFDGAGAELLLGKGRFVAERTIDVELNDGGRRRLRGAKVFIDVGTHALIPDIPGLAGTAPLTHVELLEIDVVPDHLIVLGGGYVGMEMAQAFRRFGSRVTIVQHGSRLANHEDADVSETIATVLADEGVDVLTSTEVERAEGRSGEGVTLTLRSGERRTTLSGSHVLVAVGRRPNTAGIGLETANVDLDERGFIAVSECLETTAPSVWALGECAGSPQFTHAGVDDFRIVRDNLAGGERSTRNRQVPYCLYTDPPIARIGMGEDEARRAGMPVRVAKLGLESSGRANTLDERTGFMKAIVSAEDDRLLGFVMVGPEAGEVVAAVQMAMLADLPFTAVRDAILTHPTMAEGLGPLLTLIEPRLEAGARPTGTREREKDA